MSKNTFIGVSGFSYPGWKGKFYPDDLKSEQFLTYYSQFLNSVEINSSFYAPPTPVTVKSWIAKTRDGFKFAFKATRQITHILKLGEGASDATEKMSRTLDLLGRKRGPLLLQLPPYSRQNLKLLEEFLNRTSNVDKRVFEFRHESWLDRTTYELLDKHGAGFCISETEDMKPVLQVTGGISYFRLRKDSYDAKAVDDWAGKIRETSKGSSETYVYLRHDETGENASLAKRLAEKL